MIKRADAIAALLRDDAPPYALLYRPSQAGQSTLELLTGEVTCVERLADIPRSQTSGGAARHQALAIVPYRQIAERGLACAADGAPLQVMTVRAESRLPLGATLDRIPDVRIDYDETRFDIEDDAYAAIVRRVVEDEIGRGNGSNFVIKRSMTTTIRDYSPAAALALFGRLLGRGGGAYWTFLVHTGERTLIGATPERHVSLAAGTIVMNPISGTYRYPPSGPNLADVLKFLSDRKEIDELYMVLDEELKMMAAICERGGRVVGPYLKEMAQLAHTEYLLVGESSLDPRDILRRTMFSPAVTGSPLPSACRVIRRYEPRARGYYSGVLALIGSDEAGGPALDSSILIRTADIDCHGRLEIGTGATLVRHSDPGAEAWETRAKVGGMLQALTAGPARSAGAGPPSDARPRLSEHACVQRALKRRNERLSRFWLSTPGEPSEVVVASLCRRRALVIEAEDDFTAMLVHQLRAIGLDAVVRCHDESFDPESFDLVVIGPGPGDPRASDDPKMQRLRRSYASSWPVRVRFSASAWDIRF